MVSKAHVFVSVYEKLLILMLLKLVVLPFLKIPTIGDLVLLFSLLYNTVESLSN